MTFRIPILALLILAGACSEGCMTVAALFNAEPVIRRGKTRDGIFAVAAVGDILLVAPAVGYGGHVLIDRHSNEDWPMELWGASMWSAGWALLAAADMALAAVVKNLLWGEPLFHKRRPWGD